MAINETTEHLSFIILNVSLVSTMGVLCRSRHWFHNPHIPLSVACATAECITSTCKEKGPFSGFGCTVCQVLIRFLQEDCCLAPGLTH